MKQMTQAVFDQLPVRKAIFKLALPTILALMVRALYNIVDTAYIGLLNDTTILSAVSITTPLILIINSFEVIFSIGGSMIISRQLGQKDKNGAELTASSITFISFLLGILIAIVGLLFMDPILKFLGASPAVLPYAKQYAFWMFLMTSFNVPMQSLTAIARGESEARIPSLAVMVGTVSNLILDPILMFDWGLGMGISGAAIATAISQFISFLIIFSFFFSQRSYIHLHIKKIKLSLSLFKEIIMTGLPSALTQLLIAFAAAACNIAAAPLAQGDYIIAASGVIQKIMIVGYNVVIGYVQGFQPIAAYNLGAKNYQRTIECVKITIINLIKISICASAILIMFSHTWLSIFTSSSSVISVGKALIFSNNVLFFSFALSYMMTVLCQLTNQSKKGIGISILRQGVIFIPMLFILTGQYGFNGFLLAQPIADGVSFIICGLLFIKMYKVVISLKTVK